MTEKDLFIRMLDRAGVPYKKQGNVVVLEAQSGSARPLAGYRGFLTEFEFDLHGQLSMIGIWE